MKPFSLSLSLSPRRFRLSSPVGKPERRERNLAPKRKREKEFARRVNSRASVSLSLSLSLCGLSPPLKARQIPEESKERERERINARVLYEANDGPKPQTFPTRKGKTTTTTRKRERYVFTKSIHATNLERRTTTFRGVSSRAFVSVFFFFSKFFARRKRRREIIIIVAPMG